MNEEETFCGLKFLMDLWLYLNKNEKTWSQVPEEVEVEEEEEEVTVAFSVVVFICIVGVVGAFCYWSYLHQWIAVGGAVWVVLLLQLASNHVSPHLQIFIDITVWVSLSE